MDCWIEILDEGSVRTIRVAGRIQQVHVPDLLDACANAPGRVQLDLTDVISADVVALGAFGRVRDAGAELTGVPMYLQHKLDSLAAGPRRS